LEDATEIGPIALAKASKPFAFGYGLVAFLSERTLAVIFNLVAGKLGVIRKRKTSSKQQVGISSW